MKGLKVIMLIYRYFKYPIMLSFLGLITSFLAGYRTTGVFVDGFIFMGECFILAILEISLSFDNAIINARIVEKMSIKWQKIFLYFGIFIAVFGMRILLPLIIVMLVLKQDLFTILNMAIYEPHKYMLALENAHVSLNVFGASFLSLVGLTFFFNKNKTEHWISFLEKPAVICSVFSWLPIFINFFLASISFYFYHKFGGIELKSFIISFILGNIIFYLINFLSSNLENNKNVNSSGWRSFLYLEVLDSTFSFDGVLGAFALSNSFIIIILGLSIGAFYVRSMTIMLVKERSLTKFAFIEHGAFYAILSLAIIMYLKINTDVPDYIAGLFSIVFISTSLIHSNYKNKLGTQQ